MKNIDVEKLKRNLESKLDGKKVKPYVIKDIRTGEKIIKYPKLNKYKTNKQTIRKH